MFKSIKRYLLITCIISSCYMCGCTNPLPYHDGNSKDWIMEQVEKGQLTKEQAEELLKQESEQ